MRMAVFATVSLGYIIRYSKRRGISFHHLLSSRLTDKIHGLEKPVAFAILFLLVLANPVGPDIQRTIVKTQFAKKPIICIHIPN